MSWFISLPFMAMYVPSAMHSHQKHFALVVGATIVQSSSLASLVWLFTGDKDASPYHKLSNLQADKYTLSSSLSSSAATLSSVGGGSSNIWKFGKTKVRLD
jgi:hypothetical protein